MSNLDALIETSQKVGAAIPYWTQGPGGNLSAKIGNQLWIKASGKRLDETNKLEDFACVDLAIFKKLWTELVKNFDEKSHGADEELEQGYSDAITKSWDRSLSSHRPSMEAGFHALLPDAFVFHFHSLAALLMFFLNKQKPTEFAAWLSTNKIVEPVFVETQRPGLLLSWYLARQKRTKFYILENHGVVLQSNDPGVLEDWSKLEDSFLKYFKFKFIADLKAGEPWKKQLEKNSKGALKIYFPDTAVFLKELTELLNVREGEGELPQKVTDLYSVTKNRTQSNLIEIWAATRFLEISLPELPTLPESTALELSKLPTEQFRKALT